MRTVHQRFEVATPAVFGVQRLPVRAQRSNDVLVPDYLPILEEVQVDGAPFEVDGVHGL